MRCEGLQRLGDRAAAGILPYFPVGDGVLCATLRCLRSRVKVGWPVAEGAASDCSSSLRAPHLFTSPCGLDDGGSNLPEAAVYQGRYVGARVDRAVPDRLAFDFMDHFT